MIKKLALTFGLALAVIAPTGARADKFIESPWFWGPAGLVTGGVAGYLIGRDSVRRTPVPYSPTYYYANTSCPTDGPINGTGAYYVRDKYAFPFYHKTEIYPIASTMPKVYRPQAVSMAVSSYYNQYSEPPALVSPQDDNTVSAPAGVNVTIGDNNKDVNINITSPDGAKRDKEEETKIVSVENQENSLPGRVVDMEVPAKKDHPKKMKAGKAQKDQEEPKAEEDSEE